LTPLMDRILLCFQHTVKPGSYTWRHLRPPPRRPRPHRTNFVAMDDSFDVFEPLEGLEDYNAEDLFNEELTSLEMALLLMDMGFDTCDSSSDEEDFYSP
jgi:E3 ubiquitin-protein ligase makorin